MSRSDPLLLLADIVQVASERPHLDPVLVQMLYRHLVSTRRRHTTIQQARDYIDDLTSRLDEETLWRSLGLAPPHNVSSPVQVEADRFGYPTLEEIEAKRRELAAAGRPHGFDALGGKSTNAPFPGQRSTIRRRYLAAGLPPPGSWIPGICDTAPRHPHPRPT
jgi:hypothetical protein